MGLKIFTDGGSRGNPGPASSAFVIYQNSGLLVKGSKYLGITTNNVAEYTALIIAFEKVKELLKSNNEVSKISIFSDSSLLVNQLNGLFKVKNAKIRELIMTIRVLEGEINLPIEYHHIPREKNKEADVLVNHALNSVFE